MNEVARIYDAAGNYVAFTSEEMTDTGTIQPAYGVQIGQKETAGSEIKQQIRPGLRFMKAYQMNLSRAQYIAFMRLITNQSNDYFIRYADAPALLTEDPDALATNDFKVAISIAEVTTTAGSPVVYYFVMTLASISLL